MKYLKSYLVLENKNTDEVFSYLEEIFISLIETTSSPHIRKINDVNNIMWTISFFEPEIGKEVDVNKLIDKSNKLCDFYMEVNSCIEKVKMEYPDFLVGFDRTKNSNMFPYRIYIDVIIK